MSEKTLYTNKMSQKAQNDKCKGGSVYNIDTWRGCKNACVDCYPKRLAMKKKFECPVKVTEFRGKRQDDENIWYRIGNSGDPATGWKHSEELAKKQGYKRVFCVTKLQSLKGYTGYFDKLQVSVDPFNEKHFYKTLTNVETLLKEYPAIKIILRIRSASTSNLKLTILQNEAVVFANLHNLPVMETRMRFLKKIRFEQFNLVAEDYEWRGGYFRPKHGKKFIVGAKRYYDCDLYGAKCANCSNCTLPWKTEQFEKKGEFIAPFKKGYEVVGMLKGKEYTFKTFKTLKGAKNFIANHCDETLFIETYKEAA